MTQLRFLAVLGALSLAAVSCGDDDGDDGGGSGGAGAGTGGSSSGGAATGGGTATGGAGGSGTGTMCDSGGDGTCENATDCPIIESGLARQKAGECGQSCVSEPEENRGACAAQCLVEETGIGAACGACYVALVGCATENCLSQCLADAQSAACFQCQAENGCISDFETCSGLVVAP